MLCIFYLTSVLVKLFQVVQISEGRGAALREGGSRQPINNQLVRVHPSLIF